MAEYVEVEGVNEENAILLLAAAEELKLDPSVVRTTGEGYFLVPQEVADKAFPPKKGAAKKAAAKDEE